MRIQNNVIAANIWSSYSGNMSKLQASMSRLSTGVIKSTDDPAGFGVGARMGTQIGDVAKARQNTDNSISLVQTADGWLGEISTILARMQELAVEAGGGLLAESDTANVQKEFVELQSEIFRITSGNNAAGTFNGVSLLQGGELTVQIGEDTDQTIDLTLVDLSVTNTNTIGTVSSYEYDSSGNVTGSSHASVAWSSVIDTSMMNVGSENVIGALSLAIDYVSNSRAILSAQQTRLESTNGALLTYQDNLNAAQSQIMDIDMALETTKYSSYEVLSQVASAMLAQANKLPSQVLDQLK